MSDDNGDNEYDHDRDHSPTLFSAQLATLAAVLAFVASLSGDVIGVPPAALGTVLVAVGAIRGSRTLVTTGGATLYAGVLAGGLTGDPLGALIGAALAFVAWDVAEHGIGVGEQLGREADTRRLETTHATASTAVGLTGVGVGYGAYAVAWSGVASAAPALFILGALLLTWALW